MIELNEQTLPFKPAVKAACEMLGFDPLYVANEGKLVAFVKESDAAKDLGCDEENKIWGRCCRDRESDWNWKIAGETENGNWGNAPGGYAARRNAAENLLSFMVDK